MQMDWEVIRWPQIQKRAADIFSLLAPEDTECRICLLLATEVRPNNDNDNENDNDDENDKKQQQK